MKMMINIVLFCLLLLFLLPLYHLFSITFSLILKKITSGVSLRPTNIEERKLKEKSLNPRMEIIQ